MTAITEIVGSVIAFLLCIGVAWPLAVKLAVEPAERVLVTVVTSIILVWLAGWTVYLTGMPWLSVWLLVPVSAAGLLWKRSDLHSACRDPNLRALLAGQFLVAAWSVGWVALIQSYSGGGWTGDWLEHWQRARFFLQREPLDTLFVGHYVLTARPPLANVVIAVLLELSRQDFQHYQIFMALLSSLVFLPAALLGLRWSGQPRSIAILAAIFMMNPLIVQNSTFPWTKLPAGFFVLASLYFFLRRAEGPSWRTRALLCACSIAAALLTHYSAAPYALVIGVAWLVWRPRPQDSFGSTSLLALACTVFLLVPWCAWAIANYGVGGFAFSNSAVTTTASTAAEQVSRVIRNIADTLVPHFLREFDRSLIAQGSPWGAVRDWLFQLYQLNLFFAFGSVAWILVLHQSVNRWRNSLRADRWFWTFFVATTVMLGIGVVGERDNWGLAHVCLQPLVVLGLAFLASRWHELSVGARRLAIAGATLDFAGGIALQFAVQNFALDRLLTPERPPWDVLRSYSHVTLPNVLDLNHNGLATLNEALGNPILPVLTLLAAIFILALHRTRPN